MLTVHKLYVIHGHQGVGSFCVVSQENDLKGPGSAAQPDGLLSPSILQEDIKASPLKGEHSIGDTAKSVIVDKIIHIYIKIGDMEYILYIRQQGSPENDGMSNFYYH